MKIILILSIAFISSFAHKLNLFLDYEKSSLYVYSYFASGAACKNCKIELFDTNNKLLQTLKTNNEGEYYIKKYENIAFIKVEALGGHAVSKKVPNSNEEKKPIAKNKSSFFQSIIAILLIVLIFVGLKKIKI